VFNLADRLNAACAAQRLDVYAYVNVAVRIPGLQNIQLQPDVAAVPGVATDDYYSEQFRLAADVLPLPTRAKGSTSNCAGTAKRPAIFTPW
jgi:hypothetical protein